MNTYGESTTTTAYGQAPAATYNTNDGRYINKSTGRPYKAYRNRPSKRQTLLELLSFVLLLVSVPAFLGGLFSIFLGFFGIACGMLGLFAWTRRHIVMFLILSFLVIAGCIVNIILRGASDNKAQCMPFYRYSNQFASFNTNGVNGTDVDDDDGSVFVGDELNDNTNNYDRSIWCGDRIVLYITNAVIALFALLGHVIAWTLFGRQRAAARRNRAADTRNATASRTVTSTGVAAPAY
eukprot:TRINITY_DN2821_c0_g2_i2.p1 TRINITY_DN2821_c0_g2~~TRINITY_DN2821_c0_g2_i2.p1  ORF type:complete len:237 (+),score=50.15 TRINITY_DN2821_c0_g2_i2:262-972(+)